MKKSHFRLRLVAKSERPLAVLSRAEKVAAAIGWLRSRNHYVLDIGSKRPQWGIPHSLPEESQLMRKVMEFDRRRK